MERDPITAAGLLADALQRHANAVTSGSEDRAPAGKALIEAMEAYGTAVINAGTELPEEFEDFDVYFDAEDGIEHPEEAPSAGDRIAVFIRADLVLDDPQALQSAALEHSLGCDDGDIDVEVPPSLDAIDVVRHVIGHHSPIVSEGLIERYGLQLDSETFVVIGGVEEQLPPFGDPWEPLVHRDQD